MTFCLDYVVVDPAASNLKSPGFATKTQKKMSSKPPATPMTRVDLRNLVREADDRLKLLARAEAREGRTKCRFMTKLSTKYEFVERLKKIFPGCAVYDDLSWNSTVSYGSVYVIVDWA